MTKKQTSADVSTKAARLMSENPFRDMDRTKAFIQAMLDGGMTIEHSETSRAPTPRMIQIALEEVFGDYMADVHSVAASALSQDETPGQSKKG